MEESEALKLIPVRGGGLGMAARTANSACDDKKQNRGSGIKNQQRFEDLWRSGRAAA